jgi:shikimate dehydrogenase
VLKRLAVLGHPVAHSRSPAMQNAALEALGLGGEWAYEAIDLSPEEFTERVRALPAEGFEGVNVTIPHKEAALALAGEASDAATEIGAANTLSFSGGAIRADNTDAPGLLAALPSAPGGKRALVIGAGGSARAVAWALAREGADVEVWNRTPSRADELVRDLAHGFANGAEVDLPKLAPVSHEQAWAASYELIVNCTAVGMDSEGDDPFDELPIDRERLDAGVVLVDLVYAGGETPLVTEARSRGATVVEGLEILVRQGAESLRIWTGMEPPLDVMRKAARDG